jgi:hypothetical protein
MAVVRTNHIRSLADLHMTRGIVQDGDLNEGAGF